MKKFILFVAAALCASAQSRNAELHKLFAEYYEWRIRDSPELATSVGRSEFNDRWSDLSQAAIDRSLSDVRAYRRKLSTFQPASLNEQDRLSLRILERELAAADEGFALETWYMAVSHFRGPHLGISSTIAQSPAATLKDYENLLARLRALPKLADQLGELARTAAAKNYVQPKRVAELVIGQLQVQANTPALQSPLLRPFTKFPDTIPAADQERLRKAAVEAYEQGYVPAWKRLRETISRDYLPKARTTFAMYEAHNGRELYDFTVRRHTTTNYTPQQIHQMGLREVQRIGDEMAAIRKELKFQGSGEEFVTKVLEAPEMMFKSEQEILAHGREIAKRIDPELPRLFKLFPRMPYGVKAIPPDRARTAAPYYEPPAVDGSRAGNFFLRTYQPEKQSKCCMEALIIHEAVPGHHLQVGLAREMPDVPEFRKISFFAAFIEGWALYAETLGPDLGMYQSPTSATVSSRAR